MASGEADVSPIWKQAAIVLIAVVVTGGGAWLSFGGDKVTESDLERRVDEKIAKAASESEYSRDKALIRNQLDTLTAAQARLTEQVQALAAAQADAAADRKVTNAKLDALTATVAAMDSKLDHALRSSGK